MGLDEFGLPIGDWEAFLMDLTAEDLKNAANSPLAGWAPREVLFGCAPPNPVLSKDSTIALLMNSAPSTVFYRGEDEDPLSIALRDAKATKVPNSEWATMDVNGKSVPTMEGRPYAIYSLTKRERRGHPIASGLWAFRVGPDASGALGQYISAPQKNATWNSKGVGARSVTSTGEPEPKGVSGAGKR